MTVVATFTVSGVQFTLTRALRNIASVRVVVDRLVGGEDDATVVFWLEGERDAVENADRALRASEDITAVAQLDGLSDRRLYRATLDADDGELVRLLAVSEGTLLTARGTPDAAEFVVRFDDVAALQSFADDCDDHNLPLDDVQQYQREDLADASLSLDDVELLLATSSLDDTSTLSGLADQLDESVTDLETRIAEARHRLIETLCDTD